MKTKMHFTTKFIVLMVSALSSFSVLALSPNSGHIPISQLSILAYNHCFKSEVDELYISKIVAKRILLGNAAMDEGLKRFTLREKRVDKAKKYFSPLNRVDNWHFYNPNKTDLSMTKQGKIYKSMDRLWTDALKYLELHPKPENKALFLGALLHLLEDTSVPAHVVPVYHGPTVVDFLGKFEKYTDYMQEANQVEGIWLTQMIKDAIDSMPVDKTWLTEYVTSDTMQVECEFIKNSEIKSPTQLRDEQAVMTLKAIEQPIKECNGAKWRLFWQEKIINENGQEDYFNLYNIKNSFPLFGHHGVISDLNGNQKCSMREGDIRYRQFVNRLHKQAIHANVQLLRWAARYMNEGTS